MQFTPSLRPLAQSWLRLRNLKPGKGTLAGFSFLYHVLFSPFLCDPVTSSSPRVGVRERGHAGWKRSLVTGTVVIWLWCPLCVTGAHMLIFYGTILGFTGDLHLSIADPNDTLFCWWSWLPGSWHPVCFPNPAPPACFWWDPFQFQLPSPRSTAGPRRHTPLPHCRGGHCCPHDSLLLLCHRWGLHTLSPAVTHILDPTSPEFHGTCDKLSELLLWTRLSNLP